MKGTPTGLTPRTEFSNSHDTFETEPIPACAALILVSFAFDVGDEFLEVLRRQILARQDQDRRAGEQSDRLEILLRMIGELGIKRHGGRMRAHMARDQRIAVIGRARRARGGGGAAGADHVLDDDGFDPASAPYGR